MSEYLAIVGAYIGSSAVCAYLATYFSSEKKFLWNQMLRLFFIFSSMTLMLVAMFSATRICDFTTLGDLTDTLLIIQGIYFVLFAIFLFLVGAAIVADVAGFMLAGYNKKSDILKQKGFDG